MITYLTKSNVSEGFNQIIDFLNGSSVKYALTVNPNIYVSCIKKFWTTVTVKKVNDVTKLQALVDKKKVVVTEATIRDALCLDDAEGVECLPNKEIFAELARMGYEKPSTKLTFYKAFSQASGSKWFSGVETPLFEGMMVAHEVGEGFADELHDEGFHTAGVATEGVVSATDDVVPTADEESSISSPTPPTLPPQPSHDIPSTSRDARILMNLLQEVMDTCTALTRRVEHLELDKIAQALEITRLKRRVKKLGKRNKVKGRMIADMDADANVVLEEAKDVAADAKTNQDDDVHDNADIQGRTSETQAKIYKIDLDHANKVLSMKEEESKPAELQEVVDIVTIAKIITKVVTAASTTITAADVPIHAATTAAAPKLTTAPSRRTNGVVIRDPEESTTTSTIIHSEVKSKDKGKGILVEEPKPLKKQAQIEQDEKYAKELEAEMSYDDIRHIFEAKFDSNVAFLQKTKEHIDEEESRALKRINETPAEKAAKRQKLDEEVEELKRHLQIVPNEEDDVYTEATPLSRKKNQRSVHGQAKVKSWKLLESYGVRIITFTTTQLILLVERKYLLTKFTLNQMLNNVRLEVEEESEVSLDLLRLHMDLFGPTFVKSLSKKSYCLVITDDYSRFSWVFFLDSKDETPPVLKTFIIGLENLLSLKGIKREFSVPRTAQQNGIAERKNRTLIEAARTLLADLLLSIPFWAEAVNTACYVQNRVLVTKPRNKTPYELLHGRLPSIGFMIPFGCPVTILNTLDPLGKFQGKVNEGFLVGYSVYSSGPAWLFDIDSLS
nr:hypothetical protein [Tanacetum cinerariifolium]